MSKFNLNDSSVLIKLAPVGFVVLYSTGYVASKIGIENNDPLTFQTLRLLFPLPIFLFVCMFIRVNFSSKPIDIIHMCVVGFLIHGVCFTGLLLAYKTGMSAGTVGLLMALHPPLVAVSAVFILKEKPEPGLVLGMCLGMAGVVLVIWHKLAKGQITQEGVVVSIIALLGMVASVLYQKKHLPKMDLILGSFIQHLAALLPVALLAVLTEPFEISWTASLIGSLLWMGIVLSLGSWVLFYILIRTGDVSKSQALFFLVPPTVALLAWLFFREQFSPFFLVGLVFTVSGDSYCDQARGHLKVLQKMGFWPKSQHTSNLNHGGVMSYLTPSEFVPKLIESGEKKLQLSFKDTFIRSFMAGAILAIAAAFAVTISVQTGIPIVGAVLFPVGFCLLYLLGYDLLTGVFMLTPLAYLAKRPNVTLPSILKNWGIVFCGNFAGAISVAVMTAVIFTFGFSTEPSKVGITIATIGENRTLGYKEHGLGGMLTIFIRGILCNWMVSMGVVGSMISHTVSGKVIAMWMPIMLFFAMTFEHSIVNMYLFPSALLLGGGFSVADYLIWNEFPVILGNLVGGLILTGLPLYFTHYRTNRTSLTTDSSHGSLTEQGAGHAG